jgi:hypothetical protein
VPVLGLPKLTLKRLPEGSRESANVLTMLHAGERAGPSQGVVGLCLLPAFSVKALVCFRLSRTSWPE